MNALGASFGGGSGGGGGLSVANIVGGAVKGAAKVSGARAGGGPVEAGRLYRINEAGMEGFVPANSGTIIPAGQMNAIASRGGGSQQPIELRIYADEGAMFKPRVEAISADVSVQVVREASPIIRDASVNETMRQLTRPRMPGAGR